MELVFEIVDAKTADTSGHEDGVNLTELTLFGGTWDNVKKSIITSE